MPLGLACSNIHWDCFHGMILGRYHSGETPALLADGVSATAGASYTVASPSPRTDSGFRNRGDLQVGLELCFACAPTTAAGTRVAEWRRSSTPVGQISGPKALLNTSDNRVRNPNLHGNI
jgi:hypothetical protein